jgi:hypothetical protein
MSYDTPVRILQGGSVLEVGPGGSVYMNGGQSVGSVGQAWGAIAYGTAVLTNGGSATVGVGFAIRTVFANVVGVNGSATGVGVGVSLFSSGSAILYGLAGTQDYGRGTVIYTAIG